MNRILHIVSTLRRGGTEKQMSLLACGLPRDEFDVHVCTLDDGGPLATELRAADIPTTAVAARWPLDPLALARLHRHVARLRPTAIQTWGLAADGFAWAAGAPCLVKHTINVARAVDPARCWSQSLAARWLARGASRIVVNSPREKTLAVARGLPGDTIDVIARGVRWIDDKTFTRRQLLARLGLPTDSRLVALVGSLTARKRVKDAIWAADLLKVIRDDVHLLVVGAGPLADRLRRYRDQVEIRDKVHFLGQRGDVESLLPHVDVFWSTSQWEGQSSAVLEAMAAGVAVVATDTPGTRELVAPDETGYLVAVGDRAALARNTNRLLDDVELARRLGETGRRRVETEFNAERMIARYAELYRSVLS